ncbi:MAG: UDP-N-acetylglucosamine 2-epimerase [Chthoniobacterales bacterium]
MTSSRADYGLLQPVMRAVQGHGAFRLRALATGTHLAKAHGHTLDAIEADGFPIAAKVEIPLAGDSEAAVCAAMGATLSSVGAALEKMRPDLVVVLGDRYEILAAASAAAVCRIPLAHIAGGDVTEGAVDEFFRHAITKLSSLHFVTNADARRRVVAMGENPRNVHLVGSPGLDAIRSTRTVSRRSFTAKTGYEFQSTNLLVTFHPTTGRRGAAARECAELLAALEKKDAGILFTGVNADQERDSIERLIRKFCGRHPKAVHAQSLGSSLYFSALRHFDAVVGNSSSGLYEAPSFGIPTVNIGDRQKGRLAAASVVHCRPTRVAIAKAIDQALAMDCSKVTNPYGDGYAAERIVAALDGIKDFRALVPKRFFEND